jgi:Protein of unknown function (DUF2442)
MPNVIVVKDARYISSYTLELSFSDGVKGEVDFSKWIERYPFFTPLKDLEYFKKFVLNGGTVCWENGADIAPETLYGIAIQKATIK